MVSGGTSNVFQGRNVSVVFCDVSPAFPRERGTSLRRNTTHVCLNTHVDDFEGAREGAEHNFPTPSCEGEAVLQRNVDNNIQMAIKTAIDIEGTSARGDNVLLKRSASLSTHEERHKGIFQM
jgi:hypothetical protein